jgi:hypothetical protein
MERLKKAIEDAKILISELDVGVRDIPIALSDAYDAAMLKLKELVYVDALDEASVRAILAMQWYNFAGNVENAINIWDNKASVYANKHIMVVDLNKNFGMPLSPGYLEND